MPYYLGDYYRGDYYRGDYYRGDPIGFPLIAAAGGLAKRLLPSLAKKAIGAVGALLKKPGVSTGVAVVSGVAGGRASVPSISPPMFEPPPFVPPTGGERHWDPTRALPGGRPLTYTTGGACPKGYRLNKSGYWLSSGAYVPPGSRCVRYRSMNVANGRALGRAIKRASRFAKMARKAISFVEARAPKGRARFKRKRR